VVKMKKTDYEKENEHENINEDLQFLLWKAELNKELTDFWKSMTE